MIRARDLAIALAGCLLVAASCARDPARGDAGMEDPDGCNHCGGEEFDLTWPQPDIDEGECGEPTWCGDCDHAGCLSVSVGPPGGQFPLHTDPMKDPRAADDGVGRDINGYLKLEQAHASFDY